MAKSISNTVTAQYIADDIIKQSHHPLNEGKIWLLIEGPDDKDVYYKFFNKAVVVFRPINGCGHLREGEDRFDRIIRLLKGKNINHFAIKDADFNRLFNKLPQYDNLFYTDCHDVEMMCFHNQDLLKEIFESNSKDYNYSFIVRIFKDLELLSKFKCVNMHKVSNYNFDGFKLKDGKGNLKTDLLHDFELLEQEIKKMSKITCAISIDEINDFFHQEMTEELYYEITNGHNFVVLFCFYFKILLGEPSDYCEKHLRTAMAIGYRWEHFKKTSLYNSILGWANNNGYDNIFAVGLQS